ncbi:PPE-repeat protein [Amycolatopsis sacchari]|uniref:PPE-repeat protein n=1 Tax=Amycolatopsis sacchari TaxID=115433 RepID=A0A1I3ULD5_9PSEU|nr:hypothetical protein [Amycolatopsis sacchari]SFJ82557.1 PPE-repeat protein [Amycolatopsis sacchari]
MAQTGVGGFFHDVTEDPESPYYLGPIGEGVSSGDEIRAEVTREVDDEIAKGWLGDVVTPLRRDEEIQRRYEQQIAKARDGLDAGLEIRQKGTAPSTLWENANHEQMIAALTENADSAAVAVTSEEWVRLGNELTEHQRNLADAINDSLSDWQGSGGDAARTHLTSVGKWLGLTAQGATLTGRQQEIHSQALNEAQKQMAANPPVQFDVQAANARLQTITDPIAYAQQAQADQQVLQQQEAARQQAARIMAQYDDTVAGATTTPAFPPPPKLGGGSATTASLPRGVAEPDHPVFSKSVHGTASPDNAVAGQRVPAGSASTGGAFDPAQLPAASLSGDGASGTSGSGAGDWSGNGQPGGSGSGSGSGAGVPNLPGSTYGGGSGTYGGGSGTGAGIPPLSTGDYPGGTTTYGGGGSSYSPPHIPESTLPSSVTGTDLSGTSGGSGGSSGTGRIPTIGYTGGVNGDSISSRLGGGPAFSGSLGDLDSFGGTGAGGSGLKGIGGIGGTEGAAGKGLGGIGGGGGGGKGIGGIGGGGASGAGGAANRLGPGAASGAAAAAEEAAAGRGAAGAAGAAGRAGAPGAGMPHGGRGKGEEDKEHKVADYIEGDPELFEAGQVVAPPVIGDWKKNKPSKKN